MKWFRKTIFWLHLVIGLIVGVVVALMAGTGVVLAFEHPVLDWAESADGRAPDAKAKPWSIENLLHRAVELDAKANPTGITTHADLNQPVTVLYGRDRQVFLNGYTGEKVGTEATGLRAFFHTNLELHRWLALQGEWRSWGRHITGAVAIGFLTLVLSGLWIWMPRRIRWNAFKAVLIPSLRLKGKPRDWNWHNAVGFWALVPLLVITLTGLVISYPWATGLLYRAVGETPPPPRGEQQQRPRSANAATRPGDGEGRRAEGGEGRRSEGNTPRPLNVEGLNDVWDNADAASPGWTSMTVRLGGGRRGGGGEAGNDDEAGRGGVSVVVAHGDPRVPLNRTTLTFNRRSGELLRTEKFSDNTLARRLRMLTVPIHRGEVLGLTGMAIAALASLAALVLVYTGFALSYRRLVRPVVARVRARRATASLEPEPAAV